jgi:hypothetical protein
VRLTINSLTGVGVGVRVTVGVRVEVGVIVVVGVRVEVEVTVAVGVVVVAVTVGVAVATAGGVLVAPSVVGDGLGVMVTVALAVAGAVGVAVGVSVLVAVCVVVLVAVLVTVGVEVGAGVGVRVTVTVADGVTVAVGLGVEVGLSPRLPWSACAVWTGASARNLPAPAALVQMTPSENPPVASRSAFSRSNCSASSGVREGRTCSMSAIAPAACGAAMLVPWSTRWRWLGPIRVAVSTVTLEDREATIACPGATRSGFCRPSRVIPRELKGEMPFRLPDEMLPGKPPELVHAVLET